MLDSKAISLRKKMFSVTKYIIKNVQLILKYDTVRLLEIRTYVIDKI